MLIREAQNGDHGIVIATPTKTGTEMLGKMLTKDDQFQYILAKHRITYPDAPGQRRILPVRDPYRRLQSMYTWAIKHGGARGQNFATKHCRDAFGGEWCDFSTFLRFHSTITHQTWGQSYSAIARVFNPSEIWWLEQIEDHLREFATGSWKRDDKGALIIAKTNTSKMNKRNIEFSAEDLAVVRPFVVEDCMRYGYDVR